MNKKIIIAITILLSFTAKLSFAQLFPISEIDKNQNSIYGYINSAGKIIVPMTYNDAFEFSDGVAAVTGKDWKIGYINTMGKEIIPCIYDFATSFKNGFALVEKDKERFVIDKKGQKYPITNLFLSDNNSVSDGLVMVIDDTDKIGYANLKNEIVIPLEFYAAQSFYEGHAIVKQNGLIYLIDTKGNKKKINYLEAKNLTNGLICVKNEQQRWGAINTNLEVIIDFKYEELSEFHNGYASFEQDEKFGLVNKKGEQVLPPEYLTVNNFSENRIIVQSNYKTVILLDENFKVVKEFTNFYSSEASDFVFINGISRMFFVVGPTPTAKDIDVREMGGVLNAYINVKGEVIWQGEPYYIYH